ncbi:hypothetical protein ACG04R_23270 [Roseateles sp. BYS78W]|uniref:Uncharacterized protein n=1 Tax=Pelomonas candidula TaxID=3299025 RepID=A0ABW7HIS9_9BURK
MSDSAEASETVDLFTLSERAVTEARLLADLLAGPVSVQASALIDEGYVVPAPEALAHAAMVFRSIAEWRDLIPAIQSSDGAETPRVNVISALGSAVRNVPDQLDLGWASLWTQHVETSAIVRASLRIFERLNSGERELLEAQMRDAIAARRDDDVWRR